MPWASPLSLQAGDGVNQCEGLLRVVAVGSGHLNGERNPATVANQMTFAAQLGSVGWIRSRLGASGTKPPSPDFAEIHCLMCYLALEAIVTKWMVEACDSCHAKLLSGSRDALNDAEDALRHFSFLHNTTEVRERSLL